MKKIMILLTLVLIILITISCEIELTGNDVIPTCKIIDPENEAVITNDTLIVLAEASDPNGYIKEVIFYLNGDSIGIDKKPPYLLTMNTDFMNTGEMANLSILVKDNDSGEATDSVEIYKNTNAFPAEYSGIANSLYSNYFTDFFNNNTNNWAVGYESGECFCEIDQGKYKITNYRDDVTYLFYKNFPSFDNTENFELEIEFAIETSSIDNAGNGFVWGLKTDESPFMYYSMLVSGNYGYKVKDDFGSYSLAWIPWTTSSSIVNYLGSYNKLTVRKYDDKYYFFVNEIFVGSHNFEFFYDSKAGFMVYPNSAISVDYIKMSYIGANKVKSNNVFSSKPGEFGTAKLKYGYKNIIKESE